MAQDLQTHVTPPLAEDMAEANDLVPRYRSGAVARMLRMPVATLRIWERRYQVATPATSPSGHRLYSASDVKRLALLRQLTTLGHAIGSLAPLDLAALRQVAATHAGVLAAPRQRAGTPGAALPAEAPAGAESPAAGPADGAAALPGDAAAPPAVRAAPDGADGTPRPWRVIVVGAVLARRLEQPALRTRLSRPPLPVRSGESLEEVLEGVLAEPVQADAVLLQCASLRPQDLAPLQALAQGCGAQRVHVLYGFATAALIAAFEAAGVALLRAPQDDRALASWLQASCSPLALPLVLAPRRWDDAALADFAALSNTITCECPRHVADLLMQLSSFESYSGECAHRSPADAALHAYLGQVAGTARALFEQALERIAAQEGLTLPANG